MTKQETLLKTAAVEAELRAAMAIRERVLTEAKEAVVEPGQAIRAKNYAAAYGAGSRARSALHIQADGASKVLTDAEALVTKAKSDLGRVWADVLVPAEAALSAAQGSFAEKDAARNKAVVELQAAGVQVLAARRRGSTREGSDVSVLI